MNRVVWAAIIVLASSMLPTVSAASPYKEDEEEEGHFTSPTYRYFATADAAEVARRLGRAVATDTAHLVRALCLRLYLLSRLRSALHRPDGAF